MTLRIRHIDPDATLTSQVSLEALARIVSEATVREVLQECKATERRTRKLSAAFVVILCVAMNLYTNDCISHVFFRLLSRVRWLLADPMRGAQVGKGALCQARYRLGARPLVALFKRVCSEPLAKPESIPEAFLFGLRLMAVDGTVLDLPDIRENVRVFGKRNSPRGRSAWPQARVVAISECATHAVVEAGVWPHDFDERAAARRLLRGVGEGVLLWDRGLHSFEMVRGTLARGCELLGRLPRTVKPGGPVAILSDGTQLVWVRPSDYGRRKKRGERVLVRLIRYTLEDPNRPGHRIGDLANKSWVSVTLGAAYPSRGSQNSAAQQPEARPTVHRALYELELVDEALHGSVAPPLRQPCTHRRKVFLEPLGEATLKGTDLGDADLAGARLEGADLSGANLCGTSLTRAYLTGAKLAGASYDRRTAWPEGFEPQESGAERLEP